MTAKEYLGQARSIKIQLETMAEQLEFMKSVVLTVSPQFSDMPKPNRNLRRNEDAIIGVMDFEEKMKKQRNKLNEITATIYSVSEPLQQTILVKRYLCSKTWREISDEIKYSMPRIYELHRDALTAVGTIIKVHSKT